MKALTINSSFPQSDRISQAAKVLQKGGVIAYPTETVYGIGCSAYNLEAVNRIYELKKRDRRKAMILIAADVVQISDLVKTVPAAADRLIDEFWPGPLTLVFEASPRLHEFAFRKSKTIAIRIPDSQICLSLLQECGFPLVSTSANQSGEPSATTAQQVLETFDNELDLIIDGGETPSKIPSTIVDITLTPPRLIREGAISVLEITTVLEVG